MVGSDVTVMSSPVLVEDAVRVVAANVDAIERERRMPDAVVSAVRASGLNRAVIPVELGGTESSVAEVVEAVSRIAAVDGSAGWCAAIGAGSNVFAGYLPELGAREVFADPDQGNATMFAPAGTVEHGILSGRWPFTSNCLHSSGPVSAPSPTAPTARPSGRRASCSCRWPT
jgi:alkylation response protein AidB-like acyl-CoA dehydrogenase